MTTTCTYVQENGSNVDTYANVVERNLQIALNNVTAWCVTNGMVMHTPKRNVLLITTPPKCAQLVNKIDRYPIKCKLRTDQRGYNY